MCPLLGRCFKGRLNQLCYSKTNENFFCIVHYINQSVPEVLFAIESESASKSVCLHHCRSNLKVPDAACLTWLLQSIFCYNASINVTP